MTKSNKRCPKCGSLLVPSGMWDGTKDIEISKQEYGKMTDIKKHNGLRKDISILNFQPKRFLGLGVREIIRKNGRYYKRVIMGGARYSCKCKPGRNKFPI